MFPEHEDPAIAGDTRSPHPQKLDPAMIRSGLISIDLTGKARALEERRRHEPKTPASPESAPDEMDRLVDEVDRFNL